MAAQTIEPLDLAQAARERYLRYAMSVITSRALPDVRDGLKPVQRRILYAMQADLHRGPAAKHVKSAKVVGQVIGNYHPHGDQAIYAAMVRMAQPFSLRYPLVDGQGNFGAITGDDAAAHRYTEARLRAVGSDLMATIDEDTVEWLPTFDDTGREPEVLPASVPLILLNGATGIAVGMATNIPPHNLGEVVKATTKLIDDPDASLAQLLRGFRGPDFPTGGEVLASADELRAIYEKGAGAVKLRGTYRIEEVKAKGQRVARTHIVIDSIPYGTNTAQMLAKIKEVVDAKKLPQVAHASDQTSEEDGVRIVLELKSDADADPALIMAAVYRLTPLETTFGINLTCLFPTPRAGVGRPERHCDLKTILRSWLDFRFQTVTRSLQFRKRKLEERIHLLKGFAAVLAKLTDAVKLVRAAKDKADAREKLRERFKLDEVQANAVLELQLYRLAQLEQRKILDELADKEKARKRLAALLKGTGPRWKLIKDELTAYAKAHGDKRRTALVSDASSEDFDYDPTALVKREDTHVVVSEQGRIKRIRKVEDPDRIRLRDGDALLTIAQGSTLATVGFFTNFGSAYVLRIDDVPATAGFGEPIQKFFNFKDKELVVAAYGFDPRLLADPAAGVVVVTAAGNAVRTPLEPHLEPSTKAGRKYVRLAKGDEVVGVSIPGPGDEHVLLATTKGNALCFSLEEVPLVAGVGKGKRGVALAKGERVIGATLRDRLKVETARGAARDVRADELELGVLGDAPDEVSRNGFRRALPPPVELFELPEEE